MSFWAVAQIEPTKEPSTAVRLEHIGIETYLPKITERARIVPLFPTYLFIHIVDRWHCVKNTIGVVRILLAGDRPAPLPDSIIMEIRARETNGLVKLPRRFQVGDRIRIVRGAFQNHFAIYAGMSNRQREQVLLEFMGRQVRLELEARDIAAL